MWYNINNLNMVNKYILIPLTQNKFTKIDAEDEAKVLSLGKLQYSHGYAIHGTHKTVNGKRKAKTIFLHRFIVDPLQEKEIDHINGDPLDNRKSNLRMATHSENSRNTKLRIDNTSGSKGVYFKNEKWRNKKWFAYINLNNKRINLGYFLTKEDAENIRNKAEQDYFGIFRRVNL